MSQSAQTAAVKPGDNIVDMAARHGLVVTSGNQAVIDLAQRFILTSHTHGENTDWDARVEKAFRRLFPQTGPFVDFGTPEPAMLLGPPGHGKTAVAIEAARLAAETLGLRFVKNPNPGDRIDENCFVFIIRQTAGSTNTALEGGMPKIVRNPDQTVHMGFVPDYRFASCQRAAASVVLWDDVGRSLDVIKSAVMKMGYEQIYNGLDLHRTASVFTSNLGREDLSFGSNNDDAFMTRTHRLFLLDNAEEFVQRARARWQKDATGVGAAGFLGFIETMGDELFRRPPRRDAGGGTTQPRTLDDLMLNIHAVVVNAGGMDRITDPVVLGEINDLAHRILEPEDARLVELFYHTLANGAEPIARAMVLDDKVDHADIARRYNKGNTIEGKFFGVALGQAVARWVAVAAARKPDETSTYVRRAVDGLCQTLQDSEWSYAMDAMMVELWDRVPSLREPEDVSVADGFNALMRFMGRKGSLRRDVLDRIVLESRDNTLVTDRQHELFSEAMFPAKRMILGNDGGTRRRV